MGGFLDYIQGTSPLHRLNPLTKLLIAFLLCVACFICNNHIFVLGIIVLNLLLALSAGKAVFKRSVNMLRALIKFSAFLFVIQILFVREGTVFLQLPFHLVITDLGLSFSLLFVLRMFAATMPIGLMLSVTQMSDLSNVLVEKVGVPYKYTFALTTTLRFIPLFAQEMSGIMEAQTARGVEFDTKNFFKKIKLLMPLCVPLLIGSVRKIDGAAISTELRGFHLRTRDSGYKKYQFGRLDAAALVMIAGVLTSAVML